MKNSIYKLNKKVQRLAVTTSKLSTATEVLLKAQDLLDKASVRLAKVAAKLHQISESINTSKYKYKLYIEDLWEVDVIFQDLRSNIDIIKVRNIKNRENFESLRFDRYESKFLDKRHPLMSSEGRMVLSQALKLFIDKELGQDKTGVLN